MAPPTPTPANICTLASPPGTVGEAVPEAQRQALVEEVVAAGHKISPADVVQIVRAPDGRVVWLERGDGRAGLSHILRAGRIREFTECGVGLRRDPRPRGPGGDPREPARDEYATVATPTTSTSVAVAASRSSSSIGSNGYIVSAYPLTRRAENRLKGGR